MCICFENKISSFSHSRRNPLNLASAEDFHKFNERNNAEFIRSTKKTVINTPTYSFLNSTIRGKMMATHLNINNFSSMYIIFYFRMQAPLEQVHGGQSATPTIMLVGPQTQNQTSTRAKKTQIFLGSFQIFLGLMAIIFNVRTL